MFFLFHMIFALLAVTVDNLLGMAIDGIGYGPVYLIYVFAVLLPGLGVSVRRLHDVGKSGWWLLIGLIPIIGAIWLLVLAVSDSKPGSNQYGPNPKEAYAGDRTAATS